MQWLCPGDEILHCDSCGENSDNVPYSWFYSSSVDEQVCVAKVMMKKLKNRKKIREEVNGWGERYMRYWTYTRVLRLLELSSL